MARKLDNQLLNTTVIRVVEGMFKQMCHVSFSADPVATEKDIIEYDGRMRVFPMEKFNGPAYASIINYYISQKHLDAIDPAGTVALFVKEEVVERIFKAFGRPVSEAESEENCQKVVGDLGRLLADNLKKELASLDLMDLVVAPPLAYKNAVPDGVPFNYNLFKKQQITFSFWKEACVVVEVCIGDVPARGRS